MPNLEARDVSAALGVFEDSTTDLGIYPAQPDVDYETRWRKQNGLDKKGYASVQGLIENRIWRKHETLVKELD